MDNLTIPSFIIEYCKSNTKGVSKLWQHKAMEYFMAGMYEIERETLPTELQDRWNKIQTFQDNQQREFAGLSYKMNSLGITLSKDDGLISIRIPVNNTVIDDLKKRCKCILKNMAVNLCGNNHILEPEALIDVRAYNPQQVMLLGYLWPGKYVPDGLAPIDLMDVIKFIQHGEYRTKCENCEGDYFAPEDYCVRWSMCNKCAKSLGMEDYIDQTFEDK